MALGPKELLQIADEKAEEQVKRVEKLIDEELQSRYQQEAPIRVFLPEGLGLRAQKILKGLYEKAGWRNISFGNHQTQGHWIDLSPFPPPRD